MSRTGELSWMALSAAGSPVRLAVKASQGPSPGVMTQTMSQGRTPRTPKTAIEDSPGEKPSASPGLHALQDLGVDDGVVDAGDRLEEGQSQDDQDG